MDASKRTWEGMGAVRELIEKVDIDATKGFGSPMTLGCTIVQKSMRRAMIAWR